MELYLVSRFFGQAARASCIDVPVVVYEMVKARFGDRPAKVVPMTIARTLESNNKVELSPCCLAAAGGDDAI